MRCKNLKTLKHTAVISSPRASVYIFDDFFVDTKKSPSSVFLEQCLKHVFNGISTLFQICF